MPDLAVLRAALTQFVRAQWAATRGGDVLPRSVLNAAIASVSVRPGIALECASLDAHESHVAAAKTVVASYFGSPQTSNEARVHATRAPQFVEVRHDDPLFKYFFGELLLAFEATIAGARYELIFVKYLWPQDRPGPSSVPDGTPYATRYEFLNNGRDLREVLEINSVLRRAPLVRPPRLKLAAEGTSYEDARQREWILATDVYGRF